MGNTDHYKKYLKRSFAPPSCECSKVGKCIWSHILWVFLSRKVHLVSHLMNALKSDSAFGLTSYECSKVGKCIWPHILRVFLSRIVHLVSHLMSALKSESAFGLTSYECSKVRKCIWSHILWMFLSRKVHLALHLKSVRFSYFFWRQFSVVSNNWFRFGVAGPGTMTNVCTMFFRVYYIQ